MAFGGVIGAAARRAKADERLDSGPGAGGPDDRCSRPQARVADGAAKCAVPTIVCPEIDCVRDLLPRRIIAAAEQRARSIGLGADRVLICADAITEEAYLTALASSLGTSYEPLDRVSRADCPLDDNQLIPAAAAGLLPLREGGKIIWIIAPRRLTARRLADPRRPPPGWLHSFRLTSSERLWHFVARHAQNALGRRAADGLRRARPLLLECAATARLQERRRQLL